MTRLYDIRIAACVIAVPLGLAGCGPAAIPSEINDPYEEQNRAVHAFNKSVDTAVLRPLARATGGESGTEPGRVSTGISNFAGNLDLPRVIVNDLLQFNIGDAGHNFTRFMVNSTFGLAGLLDPAADMGIYARDSDFGETLHVWGVEEGHYVELPLSGPSTKRDAVGSVVDIFLNPLSYILPSPERYATVAAGAASRIGDRGRFGDTVDSILYDSTDSYSQTRLLYLESRRFQLGGEEGRTAAATEEFSDYEEFYAD